VLNDGLSYFYCVGGTSGGTCPDVRGGTCR